MNFPLPAFSVLRRSVSGRRFISTISKSLRDRSLVSNTLSAAASRLRTRSRRTLLSAFLSFLSRFGLSSDVASRGELLAARRAGFPASKILSTGPAKSEADLGALVRAGVSIIHAEGEWELEALEQVARRLRRRVKVGLRLNPPWGIAEKRVIIGGPGAGKFGFDLASAARVLRTEERPGGLPASRPLRVSGLQRLERPRRGAVRRKHRARPLSGSLAFEEILGPPPFRRFRRRLRRPVRRWREARSTSEF